MLKSLDILVAITGAATGIIIVLISFAWHMQQQDLGIALLFACVLYVALRKKLYDTPPPLSPRSKGRVLLLTNIIFLITFIASILMLKFNLYYRPPDYFILVSIAASSIAVELIFTSERNHTLCLTLLKIIVLCLSIRAGIFYEFPTLLGSDTWGHAEFASFIAGYGHVPAREVYDAGQYNDFAIFHILVAATAIVTSAALKDALFFSVGFISIVSTLFIYLIGKSIGGVRMGLFAMLIVGTCDMFIVMGVTNILTGSLVLCWFMLIMFLQFRQRSSIVATALTIFLFFVIILTHQLTTFIVLIALIGFIIGKTLYGYFYNGENNPIFINISLISVLILGITMIAYWMLVGVEGSGKTFFQQMVIRVMSALTADIYFNPFSSPYVALFGSYSILSNVLFHPGYLILAFVAATGVLIWISPKNVDRGKIAISVAILLLFVCTYVSPLTSAKLALIPHRWLPFIYVLLTLAAAQAIVSLMSLIKRNWSKTFAVSLVVIVLTFFMLTTPYICGDSPIYNRDRASRSNFKTSEVQAVSTVAQLYQGEIMIDAAYTNVFSYVASNYNVTCKRLISDVDSSFTGMMLLRKVLLDEPTLISASGTFGAGRFEILGEEFFDRVEKSPSADLVYTNGTALAYIMNPVD